MEAEEDSTEAGKNTRIPFAQKKAKSDDLAFFLRVG